MPALDKQLAERKDKAEVLTTSQPRAVIAGGNLGLNMKTQIFPSSILRMATVNLSRFAGMLSPILQVNFW